MRLGQVRPAIVVMLDSWEMTLRIFAIAGLLALLVAYVVLNKMKMGFLPACLIYLPFGFAGIWLWRVAFARKK
jgi:hypothetical protein